ncbi:MAG: type II secretion system minor pseudopilin GspI [Steroidobacteraceae bacterium]
MSACRRPRGFTLIEVLVALAIVAIGMAAVLEAVGSSADTAMYLREKTLAEWIACNQVAYARLQAQPPAKGSSDGELDYAGRHWRWHQVVSDGELDLPGIEQIDVTVQEADTPQGKDAPWIGSASAAIGDAIAMPQSTSLYLEYAQQPGQGAQNGGSPVAPFGSGTTPIASPPSMPFGEH